jgi:hypothetical protein
MVLQMLVFGECYENIYTWRRTNYQSFNVFSYVRSMRRADNHAAICGKILYIMWDPQHLTTL